MISNNYIPEKINDANAYLDGTRMIGVAASVDLPEVNMKTGTVEGFGVGGEIDSPTIGQWESFEQEVQFNTLYSSAVDMLNPLTVVNLTFRAAQQVYDKTGGYDFKGLRVVEMGRVKKFKPGKIEKSEGMEATVTLELTYIMIEVDGEQLIEIDKLNGVYKVKGVDIPWLKDTGLPWLKEKRLYSIVKKFVEAAEKQAEAGTIDKATKKRFVVELLEANGITVTPEINAFIEAAVKELDLAEKNAIGEIGKIFSDAEQTPQN